MPDVSTIQSVVIGTSGHIDHGKTALIRALTGKDTDRLPEEKRRGISIDLGFASLDLPRPNGTLSRISFVDVPGHHAFLRNMLAGATGIDAVMLVISAEEGVKPQTEEHLAVCSLLGIRRGFTVLTKTDLVSPDRLRENTESVAAWLSSSFLAGQPILPVSALTGSGIPELRDHLARFSGEAPTHTQNAVPRLPIDRVFAVKGFGTVVTGTLQGGPIERGETVSLEPSAVHSRVRSVQTHGTDQERGLPGSRVALNLAGIAVADVHRGDTVTTPGSVRSVLAVDAEIALLPEASPLQHRARVRLHAFASEALASISLYDYKPIPPGGKAIARLRLSRPLLLLPGDRFVLRQCSPATTIGGGIVLDAHPLPRIKRAACHAWLEQLTSAAPEQQILLRIARRGMAGITLADLTAELGLTGATLQQSAAPLLASGTLVAPAPDRLLTAEALTQLKEAILAKAKTVSPLKQSQLASELRAANKPVQKSTEAPDPQIVTFALSHLLREKKLSLQGDLLTLPGASTGASPQDLHRLDQIAACYSAAGLTPPFLRTVCEQFKISEADRKRLMTLLLRQGTLVKLTGDDLYIHADALRSLYARLAPLRGQKLDVASFKNLTGLSRKHAIPLLEHLDHQRKTRREGETRIIL